MANQPPYAQYPRPGQPQIGLSARGPGVYFDAIGEAWGYIRQDMGNWVAGVLLLFVAIGVLTTPATILTRGNGAVPNPSGLGLQFAINLIPNVIVQMLFAGLVGMGVRQIRGEAISVGMMFDPFRRFGPNFLACLLYMVAIYVAAALCIVPVFYVAPVLTLMPVVAFLRELPPMEALRTTYDACKAYWLPLFGLLFVTGIVSALGVVACCVGILVTYPILILVLAIHYRAFFESSVPTYGIPPVATP